MLQNGSYFKLNPTKILGTPYPTTDRFGKPIQAVRGTISDIKKGIRTPKVVRYDHYRPNQKLTVNAEKIRAVLAKTKSEKRSKNQSGNCLFGMQCLADTIKNYNPGITADLSAGAEAMKVWVTYQTNRGLFDKATILQNDWKEFYVETPDFLKSQIEKHVAFDGREFIPNALFYSGNLYQKVLSLKEQKEAIVAEIGEIAFNTQIEKLEAAKPTILRITDGEEIKLTLSPFDKIFRKFRVSALADGTEFEEPKDLIEIFRWTYLNSLPTSDFLFER